MNIVIMYGMILLFIGIMVSSWQHYQLQEAEQYLTANCCEDVQSDLEGYWHVCCIAHSNLCKIYMEKAIGILGFQMFSCPQKTINNDRRFYICGAKCLVVNQTNQPYYFPISQ